MKKSLKIISAFLLLMVMISGLLLVNSGGVKAASKIVGTEDELTEIFEGSGHNTVTVSKGGVVTINYEKGFNFYPYYGCYWSFTIFA